MCLPDEAALKSLFLPFIITHLFGVLLVLPGLFWDSQS
jgi:hypothetical protein